DTEPAVNVGNNVRSIFADAQGDLWLGTQGAGLKRYGRFSGKFESFNMPLVQASPTGEGPLVLSDVRGGSGGSALVPTAQGGFELDPVNRHARAVPLDPMHGKGLPSGLLSAVLPARDGSLWFGTTDSGLAHWWPSSGRWQFFRDSDGSPGVLAHDSITALVE